MREFPARRVAGTGLQRIVGGHEAAERIARPVLIVAHPLAGEIQLELVGRLPAILEARAVAVLVVHALAGVDLVDRAVMTEFPRRETGGGVLRHGKVHGAGIFPVVQRPERRPQRGVGFADFRRIADDVDQARRGVLAEQHALRPEQHFDAVDVDEICRGPDITRERHAVERHAGRLFQSIPGAQGFDAADAEAVVGGRAGMAVFERGNQALEVGGVREVLLLQHGLRHHVHAERHNLDVFRATGGGHHDFIESTARGGSRLGAHDDSRLCAQKTSQADARKGTTTAPHYSLLICSHANSLDLYRYRCSTRLPQPVAKTAHSARLSGVHELPLNAASRPRRHFK